MVERLVANEKVEGSNPFARSIKIIVKKKNLATNFFQKYIEEKDIRRFKNNIFYYLYYRISRLFFNTPLKVKIYNFNLLSSNKKNNTSYSLLQKCNFFDIAEIEAIKKINKFNPIFFVDCGCNFGFYSLFTSSLSEKNEVIAIDASKKTLEEFKENLLINNFKNIKIINKAAFHINNKDIEFNISNKDWESSLMNSDFQIEEKNIIQTVTIDHLIGDVDLQNKKLIIKIDVEGNDLNVLAGAQDTIKKFSPFIIIEFSRFIMKNKEFNYDFLYEFLKKNNYQIYDKAGNAMQVSDIIKLIEDLDKVHNTIGNYYLIRKNNPEYNNIIFYNKNE